MTDASVLTSKYFFTRFLFQRSLGFIYFSGFLILLNQFRGLCGEHGILPVRLFLNRITFWDSPSLLWLNSSDRFIMLLASTGLFLSILALTGVSDSLGTLTSVIIWFLLWVIYLSFVNVGQTFYGFGWETLLLETGFLAIFLGPSRAAPPVLVIWLLRWVLFRLMFGAGLIKMRGDSCWRDLTCMKFHYETQPMPNPLSWYFHHLPDWINKGAVLFTHVTELLVPFLYFGPRSFRHWAGILTIAFQLTLILSGNLSWLNYVTIVLCIACFDDSIFPALGKLGETALTGIPVPVIYFLTSVIVLLSIRPTLNLLSRTQVMNTSFDSLHLVNTYGAFGSITRTRFEIIFEGTQSPEISPATVWKEYKFKGKPSEVSRRPPIISPYHLRLDWQLWFAAMAPYNESPWVLSFVGRLLQGNPNVTGLLRENPFTGEGAPKFIKASLYEYHYTESGEKNWWRRQYVEEYLPPLSLDNIQFREILKSQGWLN